MQPVGGSSSIVPRRRRATAQPSGQQCEPVSRQVCSLSSMQACSHANRHTGWEADVHDCRHAVGLFGRRDAASGLRESSRNMKVRAVCYNLQHISFDVLATICLNSAPDAGPISDALTKASLGLACERCIAFRGVMKERRTDVQWVESTVCGGVLDASHYHRADQKAARARPRPPCFSHLQH